MKKHQILYTVMVLLAALVLFACGGGESGSDGDPGDGDVDLDNGGGTPCYNSIDCPPPMVCVERFCVDPEAADGTNECDSQFDCPADKYCDTELGICKPLEVDGDEESQLETDAELQEIEPDAELEETIETEEEEPPLIDIQFTTPVNGQGVKGSVVLQVQVVSDLVIDRVEFFQSENLIGTAVTSEPYMQIWESDVLEEGSYFLSATAYSGDISAEDNLTVFIDRTGPHVEIITPTSGETFSYDDEIIFSLLAYDHLESVTVLVDDEEESVITEFDETDSVNHTLFASTMDAGARILKAVVQDQAGNDPVTVEVPINIEADAPELVFDGLNFIDDENAWVMANDSFTVDASDVSGLSYVNMQFTHSSTIIYSASAAEELPFEVGNFDATLLDDLEVYPLSAVLNIRVDDRYGNSVVRNINVTVKREKWSFEHGLTLPQGVTWDDLYGAAVNRSYGDVYYVYYNTLISLTTDGEERWRTTLSQPIRSSPVLFEGEGRPPVIVLADALGALHFCVDNETEADCTDYQVPDYTILEPANPALEKTPVDWDGESFDVYYCGKVTGNSRCWRLTYGFAENREPTIDEVWTLPALLPSDETPTAPIIPVGDSVSSNFFFIGCGQNIYKYTKSSGEFMDGADTPFGVDQIIAHIMPNPAGHGVYGISNKEFRLYTETMVQEGLYQLYAVTQNAFEPVQGLAHADGVFFTSSTYYDSGISKGYLQGWNLDGYSIGTSVMNFLDSSRIGGTPALGDGGMVYIPGRSNLGKFWAVRWLPDHPRLCTDLEDEGGACGIIPEIGCCNNGDLLQYCDDGVLKAEDCTDNGFGLTKCGWEETMEKYTCRSTETSQKGGRLFWRMQFGEPIFAPVTIDESGNVLIVHKDGTIRSLQASEGTPIEAGGWVKYQGDAANSGRYLP